MNDSRLASVRAALDDVVKDGVDLMDQLPSTSPYVMALRRAVRHAEEDLKALVAAGKLEEQLAKRHAANAAALGWAEKLERFTEAGYGWKP